MWVSENLADTLAFAFTISCGYFTSLEGRATSNELWHLIVTILSNIIKNLTYGRPFTLGRCAGNSTKTTALYHCSSLPLYCKVHSTHITFTFNITFNITIPFTFPFTFKCTVQKYGFQFNIKL